MLLPRSLTDIPLRCVIRNQNLLALDQWWGWMPWIRTVSNKRQWKKGLPRSTLPANRFQKNYKIDGPDMYLHRAAYPELYHVRGRPTKHSHKKQ